MREPTAISAHAHRRPRFSLLNVLFLLTIAGLGLAVWRQWHEAEPQRQEIRRLRKELGYLVVDDPTKSQFVSAHNPYDTNRWGWHMYLPPGGEYFLTIYSGPWPENAKSGDGPFETTVNRAQFEKLHKEGRAELSRHALDSGEFYIDAILFYDDDASHRDDGWKIGITRYDRGYQRVIGAIRVGKHPIQTEFDDWVSSSSTLISTPGPTILAPGRSKILMTLVSPYRDPAQRNILAPGTNCIAIWLDQQPPTSAEGDKLKDAESGNSGRRRSK
jgi:hypothetical protein